MKSFFRPNCVIETIYLLHLQEAKMHTGAKKSKLAPCRPKTELGVCCIGMRQFSKNLTPLLFTRCNVMLVEQPTTFGVPSLLEFPSMVH